MRDKSALKIANTKHKRNKKTERLGTAFIDAVFGWNWAVSGYAILAQLPILTYIL